MQRLVIILAAALTALGPTIGGRQPAAPDFAAVFADTTLRLDYYHTGDGPRESFALDRIVSDGRWAGSRSALLDSLNLGTYRFTVADSASGAPLYSRGYSSLYAEWATTGPTVAGTFHESLRFPWPRHTVRVTIERRTPANGWTPAWSTLVNPAGPLANSAEPSPAGTAWTVFESGPAAHKVDLVLVSDGYTRAELPKFHADVRRLVGILFATEPFKSRRSSFNVRAVDLPARVSGINRPLTGRFRRNPLGTSYGIFGLERYMLTENNRALRDALSGVPYEFVEILANESQYGGGGIFNFQAATAAHATFTDYVFVHEFGHHFAGLADEYYTSPVAYQTGAPEKVEPWEPNVTALKDPAALKWRALLTPGTPLPTPWAKEAYEQYSRGVQAERQRLIAGRASDAQFDSLFRSQRARERTLLAQSPEAGVVGAFEGASYEAHGLYRPQVDCIMFSRSASFCRVCAQAITRVIEQDAN